VVSRRVTQVPLALSGPHGQSLDWLDRKATGMRPLTRSAIAGIATGARSFTVLAACSRTTPAAGRLDSVLHRSRVRRLLLGAAALELAGDKLPMTPPRTAPPSVAFRVVLGALGGAVVSGRSDERAGAGALAGALGAAAWTFAGVRARAAAQARFTSDLPGAVGEDVAAIALAFAATRG
jgi:uncharacterized membrane protein